MEKVDIKDLELNYPQIEDIIEFSKRAFAHHGATGKFENEIVKRFGGIPVNTGGGNIVVLIRVSPSEVIGVNEEGIVLYTVEENMYDSETEELFDVAGQNNWTKNVYSFSDLSGEEKELLEDTSTGSVLQYKPALIDLIRKIKSEHHFDEEDEGKENMLSFGYLMDKYSIFNDPEVSGKILTLLEMGLSGEEIAVQVTGKLINKFNEYINI